MNRLRLILVMLALTSSPALADVDPVAIRVPKSKAWTGQKVSFFVDLRASGSFDGTASFSIPEIPSTVIIKIGNPVVSSEEIDGDSWFVQAHEFALFSQQSGTVTIPSFEVRFASRDGFTGPVSDQTGSVPQTTIEIQRPPGSEPLGFLVTTESIDISEFWDPQPGPAKVGGVFKRTISQSADEMTGIALAPPPQVVPDGVRVYPGDPQVSDNTERGAFTGQRQDTITYVLQKPGTHMLSAITYVWWNPKTEELRSKTLPAVTFEVAAQPVSVASQNSPEPSKSWIGWLVGAALICGFVVWRRDRIASAFQVCWHALNPPDRVAVRRLLRACRRNDAAAASRAWMTWRDLQEPTFTPNEQLRTAAVNLERHIYGPGTAEVWLGSSMAIALRDELATSRRHRQGKRSSDLPLLNPSS